MSAGRLNPHWWPFWLTLLPTLALATVVKDVDHRHWTDEFDRHFKKYSKHYFGAGFDWRWFKAQAIAESGLRPKVKSKMGATGLMQILPSTYEEIRESNPHFRNINDPKWNIAAGIYYDRQLYRRWSDQIEGEDRLSFAFGSYNAGYGNVRKAYRKALKGGKDVRRWKQVAGFAPGQTRHYVKRIRKLMKKER
jgi:soluble lytic murein transglycosylase-like protein